MSAIRCPPSCRSRCTVEHHPLLVATLNCPTDASEMALAHWRNVVFDFQQSENWCWSMPVPDPLPAYRMPMLHWACYLGKVSIVKYMLRGSGNGSNARAAFPPSERVINAQLVQKDAAGGNTPIHLCCEMLANSGKEVINRGNKYIRCLDQLLYFTTARQQESDNSQLANVINIQNTSGDTPLHIVARSDVLHSVVRQLLVAGADFNIVSSGSTALDIARECHNNQIVNILSHANDVLQDDCEDDEGEMGASSSENAHLLPASVINQLSLHKTLSRFGIMISSEGDSSDLERCFAMLQQSNDSGLIETVRSSVIDNLEQLEKHKEYLSAKLADVETESAALETRHQTDVQCVAQLKTKLESSIKERKLLAKKTRRAQHRIESMRAKREAIQRMLSEFKVPRR